MLSIYPAIFFHEKTGGYSVIFPDLNYAATCGDDLDEAMSMAIDCLAGYIYSEQRDGNQLPPPTPLDKVDIHCLDEPDEDYSDNDRFVNLVSVDVEEYAKLHFNKAVKKTISLPQWLAELAAARKVNVSKVTQKALMQELGVTAPA